MIFIEGANTSPENLHSMAHFIESCTVDSVEEEVLCDCECSSDCITKLPAFYKVGGTDRQNDVFPFMFRVLASTDTEAMELYKKESGSWVKKADLNTSALGDYYPIGTWTTYPGQSLQFGYSLEWLSVFTNYGAGEYYVLADMSIFGQSVQKKTPIFKLMEFDSDVANGTFVMKTIQNGKIKRSPFDWTGINWEQQIRLYGFFGFAKPTLLTEENLTNEYKEYQIQDEIRDEFTLEINQFLDGDLSKDFVYTRLLANEISITDYNLCNTDTYTNFEVKPVSIDDPFEDRYRKGRLYVIKFTDRYKDNFKRNFR